MYRGTPRRGRAGGRREEEGTALPRDFEGWRKGALEERQGETRLERRGPSGNEGRQEMLCF